MPDGPLTADQARAIAKEAYVYGFPMVHSYRIQYSDFIDSSSAEYKGLWNEVHSAAGIFTPEDTTIQTPNSDTQYSILGADLRAEPLALFVAPVNGDRDYSLQFIDGYTANFAYVGSRTTGNDGGVFLLAGPDWTGEKPSGIAEVIEPTPTSCSSPTGPSCSGRTICRTWRDSGRLSGRALVDVRQDRCPACRSRDRLADAADG